MLKSKKRRNVKQMWQYIMAIKKDLVENKDTYPQTAYLLESINQILERLGQRDSVSSRTMDSQDSMIYIANYL